MAKLSRNDVKHLKEMLWRGATQQQCADQFGISTPSVNHIVAGKLHAKVPWPDGSIGRMSLKRRSFLKYGPVDLQPSSPPPPDDRDRQLTPTPVDPRAVIEHIEGDVPEDVETSEGALTPEHERMLTSLGEQAEKEMENDLVSDLMGVTEDRKKDYEPPKTDWDKCSRMDWEEITIEASRNPLVVRAAQDPLLQEAVQIAFAYLDTSDWLSDKAYKLVKEIVEQWGYIMPYVAMVPPRSTSKAKPGDGRTRSHRSKNFPKNLGGKR